MKYKAERGLQKAPVEHWRTVAPDISQLMLAWTKPSSLHSRGDDLLGSDLHSVAYKESLNEL
jgi:hypothetical protein